MGSHSIAGFLADLSARTPTPGGGAAAGLAGATGAALALMVVEFSLARAALASHHDDLSRAKRTLERARDRFVSLGDEDAEAYARLNEIQRRPPEDRSGIEAAGDRCIEIPREAMRLATESLALLATLPGMTAKGLRSDLGIAAVLVEAAGSSSAWNIRANLGLLKGSDGEARRATLEREIGEALQAGAAQRARVEDACRAR